MRELPFDAVALRYDPLPERVGASLVGLRPIVCVVEQGVEPANLAAATLFEGSPKNLPSRHLFHLNRVVFVVDTSSSMGERLGVGSKETKSQYVREKIGGLAANYFPDETKVSLVRFDRRCIQHECGEVSRGGLNELKSVLEQPWDGAGTEFSRPLKKVVEILKGDIAACNKQRDDVELIKPRSLVFFLTDGKDNSVEDIRPIVQQIRDCNAMTYICGMGESYDMRRIIEIASHAGASSWSHVPLEHGTPDVFDQQIPDILGRLRAEELYIKVLADGSFTEFSALSPSFRSVLWKDKQLFSGYTPLSTGLLFERQDNIELTVEAGRHVSDSSPFRARIPIVDVDQAGAFYERVREGEQLIEKFFILRALQNRDVKLLEAMAEINPSIASLLAPAIEDLRKNQGPGYSGSHSINSAMSILGHISGEPSDGGLGKAEELAPDNHLLKRPGAGGGRRAEGKSPGMDLHSGFLGRLSDPAPSEVPPVKICKAENYRHVEPRQQFAPTLHIPEGVLLSMDGKRIYGDFPLVGLLDNREYVFGRLPSSPDDGPNVIRVVIGATDLISRNHFKIAVDNGKYCITDLNSKNGTDLNGDMLPKGVKTELSFGDSIGVFYAYGLTFRGPRACT